MTAIVYALIYLGILTFLIASIVRAVDYANKPLHLRWELYPVPHESPERVKHGGSYFEEVDWWTKPSKPNWISELQFMLPEMIFLKGLWEFNRPLWWRSFPFHFGLYLLMGAIGLLGIAGLLGVFSPDLMSSVFGSVLSSLFGLSAGIGILLAMAGAFGLLLRRLRDPALKNYTAPGDIFNLVFFLVAFGTLVVGYGLAGTEFGGMQALAVGLLTFDTAVRIPPVLAAGLILSALLIAYIPTTHMAHFIAKYFTYHSIRWDDMPASSALEMQKTIAKYLAFKPHWSAAHIQADGTKTWGDIATTSPHSGGNSK